MNQFGVLFANLLFAHLVGDFVLQSDTCVRSKRKSGLYGFALYFHAAVVAGLSWCAAGYRSFGYYALALFVSHVVIDYVKTRKDGGLEPFVFDQVLHVEVLALVAGVFCLQERWEQFSFIPEACKLTAPAIAAAIVFCLSPSNIMIREILNKFGIDTGRKTLIDANHDAPHDTMDLLTVGALIGMVERLLIFFFVLSGNYQAAGLTVAAKSLLRFRDDEGPRTEFVLVGTLLSVAHAAFAAMVVRVCAYGCSIVQ